jgi:hypothetical protein
MISIFLKSLLKAGKTFEGIYLVLLVSNNKKQINKLKKLLIRKND